MPAMSPTMTEGGIAAWKKQEGEAFAAGDVLLEIETDKATIDVEAQDDGVLAKIIVSTPQLADQADVQKADGSKGIPVGSTIAIVAEEGDDLAGADKLASEGDDAPPVVPHEDDAPAPKKEEAKKEEPKEEKKKEDKPAAKGDPQMSQGTAVKAPQGADKPTFFATPVARKIALEKGIPLGQVKGTGPDGLIQKVSHPAGTATCCYHTSLACVALTPVRRRGLQGCRCARCCRPRCCWRCPRCRRV